MGRINRKATYSVLFDDVELVNNAIKALNDKNAGLRVTPLQYTIHRGKQADTATYDDLKKGIAFELKVTETESHTASIHSAVQYDLIGKLSEGTLLTRRTIAEILKVSMLTSSRNSRATRKVSLPKSFAWSTNKRPMSSSSIWPMTR